LTVVQKSAQRAPTANVKRKECNMALRATKPSARTRRLKLLMYGDAGVGKTTACCQMPAPYLIDSERGTDNYHELVNAVGGAVFQTTSIEDVIDEVRNLSIEPHDFKTLVIDSISPLFFDLVEKCEKEVGNEWGKHYQEASKHMKRLVNLLLRLDMNVVITAHAKPEYGDEMKVIGTTFEGWKRLPYIFDLVLHLEKPTPTKRFARVCKTRIEGFPDGETFEWTFEELAKRYSMQELERTAKVVTPATSKQVAEIEAYVINYVSGGEFVSNCLTKLGIDELKDLTKEQATKMVAAIKKKVSVK